MKFCTKCGNQMSDDMVFCQKCGTKNVCDDNANTAISEQESYANVEPIISKDKQIKSKIDTIGLKACVILSFVFTGFFALGSTFDISMLAGVCLFGILGIMFLVILKSPRGSSKVFANMNCFKKTQGFSKSAFVCICVFVGLFLFIGIINTAKTPTPTTNQAVSKSVEKADVKKKNEPKKPAEFADECPVSVSASMYDNIIGLPELSCSIKNNTDKEISAVKLFMLPKDVYGDDADGFFAQNKLQCDTPIAASNTGKVAWQMLDQSVKSGDLYVYSVYFADGTEWGDRNAPQSKIKKYALKMQVSY